VCVCVLLCLRVCMYMRVCVCAFAEKIGDLCILSQDLSKNTSRISTAKQIKFF
jgi:hypothetical protein